MFHFFPSVGAFVNFAAGRPDGLGIRGIDRNAESSAETGIFIVFSCSEKGPVFPAVIGTEQSAHINSCEQDVRIGRMRSDRLHGSADSGQKKKVPLLFGKEVVRQGKQDDHAEREKQSKGKKMGFHQGFLQRYG